VHLTTLSCVSKSCHSRNEVLSFTSVHEEPVPRPHCCGIRLLPNVCVSSTKLLVAPMLLSYLFLICWIRAPPNKAMRWSIEQGGTVTPSHVQWPRHPVHQFFVCGQPLCCVSVLFVCVRCPGLRTA
jgi:hypothetical protein